MDTSKSENMNWANFDEYIRQGEPDKKERATNWRTAIGLQSVDGLRPSEYLIDTARRNIDGDINIDEVKHLLKSYYQSKSKREPNEDETEEADRVSANIVDILSTRSLDFSTNGLVNIHRRIFDGVFKFAGKIRDYDISKKEWVLNGQSVSYLNYQDLRAAVDYDIQQEKLFDYKGLNMSEIVAHISHFVSGLWQIHPFAEGNTRTTAIFTIQYLRSIGFDVNNDMFTQHSWYFRNALVRANYKSAQLGINYDHTFLEAFFRNLLMGETNKLKNRYLHIDVLQDQNITDDTVNDTVNDTASQLIAIIKKHPEYTYDEFAQALGVSRATIARHIKKLSGNVIKRVGSDKIGYWQFR